MTGVFFSVHIVAFIEFPVYLEW